MREAVSCTMSSDFEWKEIISLLSARVSLLEARFRKGKAESATSFIQGREEGVHNGRWQSKDANFIDLILNYLAEYYPLEPLIGEEPQDMPWFVINEFKKCALDTTSIKTHLLEKFYHDLSFFYGDLGNIDKVLHVNPTSNSSTDDHIGNTKGIKLLLNNIQVCTYLANITHDERKVMHIMTTRNDKYIEIFKIIFSTLKKRKYSVQWIQSMTSEIQAYKSMEESNETKKKLLKQIKVDILNYQENHDERSQSIVRRCVRKIQRILYRHKVVILQDSD